MMVVGSKGGGKVVKGEVRVGVGEAVLKLGWLWKKGRKRHSWKKRFGVFGGGGGWVDFFCFCFCFCFCF